jgi:hypothetical protein
MHIYIYIERERERESERSSDGADHCSHKEADPCMIKLKINKQVFSGKKWEGPRCELSKFRVS